MPQHKNDMLLVAAPRASMAEVVSGSISRYIVEQELSVLFGQDCCSALLLSSALGYTAHTRQTEAVVFLACR